jgi:hypothetical protein
MSALPQFPADRLIARADQVGSAASFVCAVHCASFPVLLALLPASGVSVLASELLERSFVLFATVLALSSLIAGYRRHGSLKALQVLVPGLALIWFGSFGPLHHELIPHAVLMTLGGLLVAFAHLRNQRLSRHHVHGPRCSH